MRSYPKSIVIGLACLVPLTDALGSQPLSAGQINYMLQCQGCHKSNGEGIEETIPDLRDIGPQLLAVPAGRQFYVSVPGSANAPLSNQELAEVLNFIISDILGNEEGRADSLDRFTADEVAGYRSFKIPDVKRLREDLARSVTENSEASGRIHNSATMDFNDGKERSVDMKYSMWSHAETK